MTLNGRTGNDSDLRASLRRVTIGGTLAMVWMACVFSPAGTEFYREIGANEMHFGLMGGLPMALIILQFVGAVACNRLKARKPVFMACFMIGRLGYLPVVLIPFLWPNMPIPQLMAIVIFFLALSSAMQHFATPLWFSWMADLVPRPILNRYWGARQRWLGISWALSFFGVTIFLHHFGNTVPATYIFPLLVVIGVTAGLIDIVLFWNVREPPNEQLRGEPVLRVLTAPIRHPQFRFFVIVSCLFTMAAMCAASFMGLFILKILGVPIWAASLLWCIHGSGAAISSRLWGRIADKHGHRPVMQLCISLKPLLPFAYLLINPTNVYYILPFFLLLDGILNAGNQVASHGYMMKVAPRKNRSMFTASFQAFSGICAGIATMVAGYFLRQSTGWTIELGGATWTNYHAIFLVSIILRCLCIPLVRRISEPESSRSGVVLNEVIGATPLRFLLFPIAIYRRWSPLTASRNGDDASMQKPDVQTDRPPDEYERKTNRQGVDE